jgi:5'-nucleotidase/UDP-sugar diphosphatase
MILTSDPKASTADFSAVDETLTDIQRLAGDGIIRRYVVIERGGIRFGIFGVLVREAIFYTTGGATKFSDGMETAKEMEGVLRDTEKVDVVICLSHGGLEMGKDGRFTDGDDVRIANAVPGIDVVIGGHSHTLAPEGDHRQWPDTRGPDRKGKRKPWRAGRLIGRQQADL